MRKNNYEISSGYTFNKEDDWGDYYNGKYRDGVINERGYRYHWYNCTDGKRHHLYEHRVKWEYFNGKIPDGYEIDHIIPVKNGGTNRLSNLRLVTHPENIRNPNSYLNRSESHKGQKAWNKGVPMPDELKNKISSSKDGIKVGVVQLNGDTLMCEYESIREAERVTKISHTNIRNCCNGGFFSVYRGKWVNVRRAGGYRWMYKEDYKKMLAGGSC